MVCPQNGVVAEQPPEAVGGVGRVGVGERQKRRDQGQGDHERERDAAGKREAIARKKRWEPLHVLILGSIRL